MGLGSSTFMHFVSRPRLGLITPTTRDTNIPNTLGQFNPNPTKILIILGPFFTIENSVSISDNA